MRGQKKACGESRDSFICEIKQIDMLMRTWEAVAVSPVVLAYHQTVWEDMDTRNKTTTIKINKKNHKSTSTHGGDQQSTQVAASALY